MADAFALEDDVPTDFTTIADTRIAIYPTPHPLETASRDALEMMAHRLEEAGAHTVRLDLAEVVSPMQGLWDVVSRLEGRPALLNLGRLHPHLLHKEFVERVDNVAGFTRANLLNAYDTAVRPDRERIRRRANAERARRSTAGAYAGRQHSQPRLDPAARAVHQHSRGAGPESNANWPDPHGSALHRPACSCRRHCDGAPATTVPSQGGRLRRRDPVNSQAQAQAPPPRRTKRSAEPRPIR
jgi:hypothetical protein